MKIYGLARFLVVIAGVFSFAAFCDNKRTLEFDTEVVEGVVRQSVDSFSKVRNERLRREHLYQKRADFRKENSETLKVMTELK